MLLGTVLLVLPAKSHAEPQWTNKPVYCGTQKEVIDITKKFREMPLFSMDGFSRGKSGEPIKTRIVVAFNERTKTWSLVEFSFENDMGCIIGSGKGLHKLLDISTTI
jgi:hypothetical protein